MTTKHFVGAASDITDIHWHSINWSAVNKNVRRLQARIVKATQVGRWNKVKALQRLLTHSFGGKVSAVRRVTENTGRRTAGVDKVLWDTSNKKIQAVAALRQRGYKPLPLRRIYIPKSNGVDVRPLSIPTMRDRAMQALYLLGLDPIAETLADPNSYGFRTGRSCADAIEQCFCALGKRTCSQWILEGDIKSCFDTISHDWLLANVPMNKAILQKWLTAGYLEKQVLRATTEGTPQGGIISPLLANFALDGLEQRLRKEFPRNGRGSEKGRAAGVHLVRYADDFIITGKTKELLEERVKPLVEDFLRTRGMRLSIQKTRITHVAEGFDFLGQNVRKYENGKLLIKPSKKNIKTFLAKIRKIIRQAKGYRTAELIQHLNPKIRGWANYHRHVVSKRIFSRIDSAIFKSLWKWARQRHCRKSLGWIKQKYFCRKAGRDWLFFGEICDKNSDGKGTVTVKRERLYHAATMPIKRHVKVKTEANPYDREWRDYFQKREKREITGSLENRRLLFLWREQNGLCGICRQPITRITGWHSHHIVHRAAGGSDETNNRVLLHPECHRSVHSQGLEVVKPRSKGSVKEA